MALAVLNRDRHRYLICRLDYHTLCLVRTRDCATGLSRVRSAVGTYLVT